MVNRPLELVLSEFPLGLVDVWAKGKEFLLGRRARCGRLESPVSSALSYTPSLRTAPSTL